MEKPKTSRQQIFSRRFLVFLLAVSILANIILITKLKFPTILYDIQIAFIPAPEVVPIDHVLGNPDAKYTIIEYTDLQCPYCARLHEAISAVMKQADLRLVFRHFPLSSHPFARKAAEASECAGEQGKFWEYIDALFALKGNMTDPTFGKLAQDLKLDTHSFGLCLNSGKFAAVVAAQRDEGVKKKIRVTPTFWLNNKRYEGSVPIDELRKMVNARQER
jgi:protein-disulfide isomerase